MDGETTARAREERAAHDAVGKVPAPTAGFWITKILATTLGETGGDALSMSMGLGYATASGVFALLFAAAVALQLRTRTLHRAVFWLAIVASTTLGTTLADFADRSLGIGYPGGVLLLATLLASSLALWRRTTGSVAPESVRDRRSEALFSLTIMCSQTLGTALGDWAADSAGLGYGGAAIVFGALVVAIAIVHHRQWLPRTTSFWSAFVLTRPLGAAIGDLLDKPVAEGGFAMSRIGASLVLFALVAACVAIFRPRRAKRG